MKKNNHKNEMIIIKPNSLRGEASTPLAINEQRVLMYSIFKIQHDRNSVSFTKQELDNYFNLDFGSFKDIKKYMKNLRIYGAEYTDEKTERVIFVNAFSTLEYNMGVFTFEFNPKFLPAINTQKRYLRLGMKGIANFCCKYSLYLYDFLKDSMFGDITVKSNISLTEFKAIFKLKPEAYKGRNSNFKARVWEPAMNEINMFTDYDINIVTKGRGDAITFTVVRIHNEDFKKQKKEFVCPMNKKLLNEKCAKCYNINKCTVSVDPAILSMNMVHENESKKIFYYMYNNFYVNPHYCLDERVRNNVANAYEKSYYDRIMKQAQDIQKYSNTQEPINENEVCLADKEFVIEMYKNGEL